MREQLYLRDPASLLSYSGQGELRSWLRAAVLHLLINIKTRESRERPTEGGFFEAFVDASPDAEAAYLKEACREEFEQSFMAALGSSSRARSCSCATPWSTGRASTESGPSSVFTARPQPVGWPARDHLVDRTRAELVAALRIGKQDAATYRCARALRQMGTTLDPPTRVGARYPFCSRPSLFLSFPCDLALPLVPLNL